MNFWIKVIQNLWPDQAYNFYLKDKNLINTKKEDGQLVRLTTRYRDQLCKMERIRTKLVSVG